MEDIVIELTEENWNFDDGRMDAIKHIFCVQYKSLKTFKQHLRTNVEKHIADVKDYEKRHKIWLKKYNSAFSYILTPNEQEIEAMKEAIKKQPKSPSHKITLASRDFIANSFIHENKYVEPKMYSLKNWHTKNVLETKEIGF